MCQTLFIEQFETKGTSVQVRIIHIHYANARVLKIKNSSNSNDKYQLTLDRKYLSKTVIFMKHKDVPK